MRLFKVLTIALILFFSTTALYSQAPPPTDEAKDEQSVADPSAPEDKPDPSGPLEGTSVPLDGGLLMAMLAGGGIAAGLLRKSTKKKD